MKCIMLLYIVYVHLILGRLPIRVNLKGLTEADLLRILTEPEASLIKQQVIVCSCSCPSYI